MPAKLAALNEKQILTNFFLVPVLKIISVQEIYSDSLFGDDIFKNLNFKIMCMTWDFDFVQV